MSEDRNAPKYVGYLVVVLIHLLPQELNNRTPRTEGQRLSFLRITERHGVGQEHAHAAILRRDRQRSAESICKRVQAGAGTMTYNIKGNKDDYKLTTTFGLVPLAYCVPSTCFVGQDWLRSKIY